MNFFLKNIIRDDYKIYNRIIQIEIFKKEFIDKLYLSYLNDKKINQFLSTKKKKQTKKSVFNYFCQFDNKKYFFFGIFDKKKNKLIGTITFRKVDKNSFYIGFMIGNNKYIGTKYSNQSINMFLCFAFDYFKLVSINAGTNKFNFSSNFCLVKNGFQLVKKGKKYFSFQLRKKNLKFTTDYKIKC